MAVELKRRLLSAAEYHKMIDVGIFTDDDRLELLNGEIFYLSPIGSQHAAIVRKLDDLLRTERTHNFLVSVQNLISISDLSGPEPDIAVLKWRDDYYSAGHPEPADVLLVIEVADSSIEKDRQVKLPIYAKAGIPVYWIINLEDRQVEIHVNPDRETGVYKVREIATWKESVRHEALGIELLVKDIIG